MILLADAGHNSSNVDGLVLACGAWQLSCVLTARRIHQHAFRLLQRAAMVGATASLARGVADRSGSPGLRDRPTIMKGADIGIAVETATALLFMRDREVNCNIRGAFVQHINRQMHDLARRAAQPVLLLTDDLLCPMTWGHRVEHGSLDMRRARRRDLFHKVEPSVRMP